MKIIFCGTSEIGLLCLDKLFFSKLHEILCVVTSPDKKAGRGLPLKSSLIKEFALKNKIPIFQPQNVNCAGSIKFLTNLDADVFVVIAYGQIFKKEILKIPKIYCLNVHTSLLPKYRGAAPINWAIANGEIETGVTVMIMNEFMDKGDIILQEKINIEEDDDAISLGHKIAQISPLALLEALHLIETKTIKPIAQNDKFASFAPLLKKSDGLIKWKNIAPRIHNQVRGFAPWPTSFTFFNKLKIKIIKTDVSHKPFRAEPGEIIGIEKEGIYVATSQQCILIKELQPEAKKIMTAREFVNGYKIKIGDHFIS